MEAKVAHGGKGAHGGQRAYSSKWAHRVKAEVFHLYARLAVTLSTRNSSGDEISECDIFKNLRRHRTRTTNYKKEKKNKQLSSRQIVHDKVHFAIGNVTVHTRAFLTKQYNLLVAKGV